MSGSAAPGLKMSPGLWAWEGRGVSCGGVLDGEVQRMAALRDHLESPCLPQPNLRRERGSAPRVPNTTNIYFDNIEGEALIIALDLKGLALSTGGCMFVRVRPSLRTC